MENVYLAIGQHECQWQKAPNDVLVVNRRFLLRIATSRLT
jgi:hypothetical protein